MDRTGTANPVEGISHRMDRMGTANPVEGISHRMDHTGTANPVVRGLAPDTVCQTQIS